MHGGHLPGLDGRAGVPLITRLSTALQLLGMLARRGRWFLIPFVLVLLGASVVLVGTQAMPWLAPFVYVAF